MHSNTSKKGRIRIHVVGHTQKKKKTSPAAGKRQK